MCLKLNDTFLLIFPTDPKCSAVNPKTWNDTSQVSNTNDIHVAMIWNFLDEVYIYLLYWVLYWVFIFYTVSCSSLIYYFLTSQATTLSRCNFPFSSDPGDRYSSIFNVSPRRYSMRLATTMELGLQKLAYQQSFLWPNLFPL